MTEVIERPIRDWADSLWDEGLCRLEDPSIFWIDYETDDPESREYKERTAKRICGQCPIREACAVYGLRNIADRWGIYGGLTHRERLVIRRELGWNDGVGR